MKSALAFDSPRNKEGGSISQRLKKIYSRISQDNLDVLILSHPPNITYLTEYPSRDSYYLLSPRQNVYITDSRYTTEARLYLKDSARVVEFDGSVFKSIASICNQCPQFKRLGFEERYLAFAEFQKIKAALKPEIQLLPTSGLVEALRQIKEPSEIKKIKEALRITQMALRFVRQLLRPGSREIEVVAELERFIRYAGASGSAFEIIVASGPNSSLPHHLSGQRKIKNNEPVLVDLGVDFSGYKSDLTRMFFLGKINPLFRRVYDIVFTARKKAIRKLRPGVAAKVVDAAARNYIGQKGFANFFGHNLGHGLGLEVHESPLLSPKGDQLLEKGMVFTVEPGIYLPGKFGIRIEDVFFLRAQDAELLSAGPEKIEDIQLR